MSEIEPFPSAVLSYRYPEVPNLGDFTAIDGTAWCDKIDLLVGGTPCQAFSVAGLRQSLSDERGNLSLEFCRLADAIEPKYILWENVPGVLSISDNAFGCFLGALVGADSALVPARGQRWTNSGLVSGPRRTAAWVIKDAQFFGVAQRRRRVFVLAVRGSGNWRCAEALFPQFEGMYGHLAPRREARENVAGCTRTGLESGVPQFSRIYGTDEPIATLNATGSKGGAFSHAISVPDVARCLSTSNERIDWETETFVTHSLRADGFDASEDGTGRGTPLVPCAFNNTGAGWWDEADAAATVRKGDDNGNGGARESTLIAFSAKDHGADAMDDCAPTLRAGGHTGSHANAGVMPAVAFGIDEEQNGTEELIGCLKSREKGGGFEGSVMHNMAVRRLTPTECERLQGFPDSYTLIPFRGKPAADGPRYKALGNSMAVPVMAWIGQRIQLVEDLA